MKEKIEESKTESLYKHLLPKLTEYTVALLKVLLAAAPSNKVNFVFFFSKNNRISKFSIKNDELEKSYLQRKLS